MLQDGLSTKHPLQILCLSSRRPRERRPVRGPGFGIRRATFLIGGRWRRTSSMLMRWSVKRPGEWRSRRGSARQCESRRPAGDAMDSRPRRCLRRSMPGAGFFENKGRDVVTHTRARSRNCPRSTRSGARRISPCSANGW